MPVDFPQIIKQVLLESEKLAVGTCPGHVKEATSEARKALKKMKGRLEKWSSELADGKLTRAEFEFLIQGQKDLLELVALKGLGISRVRTDEFANGVLKIISSTILSALKL